MKVALAGCRSIKNVPQKASDLIKHFVDYNNAKGEEIVFLFNGKAYNDKVFHREVRMVGGEAEGLVLCGVCEEISPYKFPLKILGRELLEEKYGLGEKRRTGRTSSESSESTNQGDESLQESIITAPIPGLEQRQEDSPLEPRDVYWAIDDEMSNMCDCAIVVWDSFDKRTHKLIQMCQWRNKEAYVFDVNTGCLVQNNG